MNTLPDNASEAKINAAVAKHCAPNGGIDQDENGVTVWRHADGIQRKIPDYLHDASAVLALLASRIWKAEHTDGDYWFKVSGYEALAPTFCRAACLALLRANGVNVAEAK